MKKGHYICSRGVFVQAEGIMPIGREREFFVGLKKIITTFARAWQNYDYDKYIFLHFSKFDRNIPSPRHSPAL